MEDMNDLERMSQVLDYDSDDQETVAVLHKSIREKDGQKNEFRDPIDKCEDTIKTNLQHYKIGLSSGTAIENMVSSVTSNYLQKFASEDSKSKIDQAMQEFIQKHSKFDIKSELEQVQHRIALEMYHISRVVDDGNFHKVLDRDSTTELKLIYDIPVCCKISLEGQMPPLHIKFHSLNNKTRHVRIYVSFKETEPMKDNCDQEFIEPKGGLVRIVGERGPKPNVKVFSEKMLYLTFLSSQSTTIEVRPQFIDPAKAGSLKFVTQIQVQKLDTSVTGVDEPKLPPQKTMIEYFKNNKQNYTEIKAMIEETKKKENEDFGKEIVKAALEVRDQRDLKNFKKDFLAEHTKKIKNWHDVVS